MRIPLLAVVVLCSGCMTSSLVRGTFGPREATAESRAVALSGAAPFSAAPAGSLPVDEGLLLRLVFDDGSVATAAVPFAMPGMVLAEDHPAAPIPAAGSPLEPGRWLEVDSLLVALDVEGHALRVRDGGDEKGYILPAATRTVAVSPWLYWTRVGFFPIVVPLTAGFDLVTLPVQAVYAATQPDGIDALISPAQPPPQLP